MTRCHGVQKLQEKETEARARQDVCLRPGASSRTPWATVYCQAKMAHRSALLHPVEMSGAFCPDAKNHVGRVAFIRRILRCASFTHIMCKPQAFKIPRYFTTTAKNSTPMACYPRCSVLCMGPILVRVPKGISWQYWVPFQYLPIDKALHRERAHPGQAASAKSRCWVR